VGDAIQRYVAAVKSGEFPVDTEHAWMA
jgi:ketopantoate hydroxymethyltransferase